MSRRASPVPVVTTASSTSKGENLYAALAEGKKCIHGTLRADTGAPARFLSANVSGPWINPDAIEVDRLVEISHACPSGAIRSRAQGRQARRDRPQVNLIAVREAGPYAVRADIHLTVSPLVTVRRWVGVGLRRTSRSGDGSHHEVGFSASWRACHRQGIAMLAVRDGVPAIDPQIDGPPAGAGAIRRSPEARGAWLARSWADEVASVWAEWE